MVSFNAMSKFRYSSITLRLQSEALAITSYCLNQLDIPCFSCFNFSVNHNKQLKVYSVIIRQRAKKEISTKRVAG